MTDDQARQYIVEYMESTIGIVKRRKTMYTLVVVMEKVNGIRRIYSAAGRMLS